MKHPYRSIVGFVGLIAAAALVAQLGGMSSPSGSPHRQAAESRTCDGPPTIGDVRRQDPVRALERWQEPSASDPAALASADVAVEAEVVSVADNGGEPPMQTVGMIVCAVLDGEDVAAGQAIEVEHPGDSERHIAGDPFYSEGERYALYLVQADEGRYRVVDAAGRHLLRPDGTAEPVT